jgi:DNA repair protein RadC
MTVSRLRFRGGDEVAMSVQGAPLFGSRALAEFFAPLVLEHDYEHAVVAHIGIEGRLVAISEAQGGGDQIILPLRTIVHDALSHDGRAVLIAHNHPSGDPTPSEADIETTRRLADLLRPLSIRVFDHLILTAQGGSTSFRDLGWL